VTAAAGVTDFPAIGEVGRHADAVGQAIERARTLVPFYAAHHRGISSLDLADQPSCTKADLRQFGPFPLSAVPLPEMWRVAATSGTTGPRLFVGYTERDWLAVREQYERIAAAIGLRRGDVLLNTHGAGLWIGHSSLEELAHAGGCAVLPCGPTNADQVLAWLEELPVTLLSATPSYMRMLVETASARGVELAGLALRMGLLGGEGASAALRRHVTDAFGGRFQWQELYGSTETAGPILGFGSPRRHDGLEINTDYFVVELLRPDRDEPVAAGELGEITLTTPYREGTPLIRYRTRDLTRAVDGHGASGFPLVDALHGRIDDAIKVRGALVYPAVVDAVVVESLAPGAEWRVVLTREIAGLDVLTVVVESDGTGMSSLADDIHQRTGVRPVVQPVAPGSLERFAGKARRVVDERGDD
jgi:phenylacetate-CoA ligase